MAIGRPQKNKADWFSHDADASDGRTVTILESNFGSDGYATWFKLLERLSRTENHLITCRNGEDTEFLAAKFKLPPDRFRAIINKMADLDAIDSELWDADKIIWCQNLVDRLRPIYENRKRELPHKPIVSTTNKSFSTTDKPLSIPEMALSSDQSKVKESKVKESKVKESKVKEVGRSNNMVNDSHLPAAGALVNLKDLFKRLTGKNPTKEETTILQTWAKKFTADSFPYAFKEAAELNKLSLDYVFKILERIESER